MFGELNNEDIELIKKEDDLIDKSIIIVNKLFKDKKDKEGKPYINHLYYVMNSFSTYKEKIVGLMHDTIEDTSMSLFGLMRLGYPIDILKSINLLTHYKGVPYDKYIDILLNSGDITAIKVKYADMTHNLNEERLAALPIDIKERLLKKYSEPYKKLTKRIEKIGKEN